MGNEVSGLNMAMGDYMPKDYYKKIGESVQRLSGTEIAGNPVERIRDMVKEFDGMDVSSHILREMETFEEMMVALYIIKYKIMKQKQADYGPKSIQLGDELDIVGLINKKMERARNLIGDPARQLAAIKDLMEGIEDDATYEEIDRAFSDMHKIVFPSRSVKDESIEDTAIDASNYGDILFLLIMKVWGKPLEGN